MHDVSLYKSICSVDPQPQLCCGFLPCCIMHHRAPLRPDIEDITCTLYRSAWGSFFILTRQEAMGQKKKAKGGEADTMTPVLIAIIEGGLFGAHLILVHAQASRTPTHTHTNTHTHTHHAHTHTHTHTHKTHQSHSAGEGFPSCETRNGLWQDEKQTHGVSPMGRRGPKQKAWR